MFNLVCKRLKRWAGPRLAGPVVGLPQAGKLGAITAQQLDVPTAQPGIEKEEFNFTSFPRIRNVAKSGC